jgi:acetyl esterase/lipase
MGGGDLCTRTAVVAAGQVGARVWSVDYRMPPDHPYPTPLDDCVTVYRALLEERRPEEIVVGGVSAGGNLAGALVLRARDEGLPLPAAVVLHTGAFDLAHGGDSWNTNAGLDPLLDGSSTPCVMLYAGDHDLKEPYLSPLYGDLEGFPPTILLTGTRDMLLSDNVRMHRALRAAGVDARLHVWEAAGHGGFLGMAPEDAERGYEIRRFAHERWARAAEVSPSTR